MNPALRTSEPLPLKVRVTDQDHDKCGEVGVVTSISIQDGQEVWLVSFNLNIPLEVLGKMPTPPKYEPHWLRPNQVEEAEAPESRSNHMTVKITLQRGDICTTKADAIVNAANERMLGGGGVDGAIHRAAGPGLREECARHHEVTPDVRCPTGEARVTRAHNIPVQAIIHTVGPIYAHQSPGAAGHNNLEWASHPNPAEALASCFRNVLRLCVENGFRSVAIPAISCGIYGYPPELAAEVARKTIQLVDPDMDEIIFVLWDEHAYDGFRQVFIGVLEEDLSGLDNLFS